MSGPLRKVSQKYYVDLPLHLNNSLNSLNSLYVWHFPGLNPPWPSMAGRSWPMDRCCIIWNKVCTSFSLEWKLSEIMKFWSNLTWFVVSEMFRGDFSEICNGRQIFIKYLWTCEVFPVMELEYIFNNLNCQHTLWRRNYTFINILPSLYVFLFDISGHFEIHSRNWTLLDANFFFCFCYVLLEIEINIIGFKWDDLKPMLSSAWWLTHHTEWDSDSIPTL